MNPRSLFSIALLSICIAQLQLAQDSHESTEPQLNLEFVKINPGEFQMGCTGEVEKCKWHPPAHPVRIDRGFEAGKFQVTVKQWKSVMGEKSRNNFPFYSYRALVSWDETQLFIQKMNEMNDGYFYRLPTDAEWEYMARASTDDSTPVSNSYAYGQLLNTDFILLPSYQTRYSEDLDCSLDSERSTASIEYRCARENKPKLGCGDNFGQIKCPTIPPPKYFKNRWGLYDMTGQTPEWIEDWPRSESQQRLVRGEIETGNLGPMRVFIIDAEVSREKRVYRNDIGYGFRCVRERRD